MVDCCTREVTGWTLDLRTRTEESVACVEQAVHKRAITPGLLTLGTDTGPEFTSRGFRKHLSARGITHRRGGYRDPESQAFIEPGSTNSRNGSRGDPNGRPSTKHDTTSPTT